MEGAPPIRPMWRGRLVVALLVFAVLAVLSLVHGAVQVHAWFENRDSQAHWRETQEQTPDLPPDPVYGSPARRIQRLEEESGKIVERLQVSIVMLVFSAGLVWVGARALRRR